ncbi:hypothetical protein Tco_0531828 [Tanacetum coccineum]
MEECHKLLTDKVDDAILKYNVSKPLPLGGEPGHITIQSDFFFNKDLEYLRYGRKIGRPALSISKMKAAFYPDVGLEQLVPDQFSSEGDRRAVRTHMRILSVVRIEVFSLYGYNYMKKIILRRADLKEYVIAERDFKYMYPSDFEDLNCYPNKRVEEFLAGIESYQTQLNLTKPRWDATGFEFKHDYTIIDSPRAVTFRTRYGVQMIMRFKREERKDPQNIRVITKVLHHEDGNPSRANIKQALGREQASMETFDGYHNQISDSFKMEILSRICLKMNLPDHEIKVMVEMEIPRPVESIHSPMLTLNVFNQRHHDNRKTYNTASATLISNVMIKKSVSMQVRRSQRHLKAILLNKDDQEIYNG